MAGQSYAAIPKVDPAQGFATTPLFSAEGKWLNVCNFRFYRGVAFSFLRKLSYVLPSPITQTLTIPNPTCLISSLNPNIPLVESFRTSVLRTQPFDYTISATNSPISYSCLNLPGGLSVNTLTGEITGSVSLLGTYTITLKAYNVNGVGIGILTLIVANPT